MDVDSAYDKVLSAFDKVLSGTAVVTVNAAEMVNGMTAVWFTRVAYNPPMVAVSISYKRFTYDLIKLSGFFCLNLLAEDQLAVAKRFGVASGRDTDKFKGLPYNSGKSGSPILEGIAGYLDCKLTKMVETGDYMLFIGEVIDAQAHEKTPLLMRNEDYA